MSPAHLKGLAIVLLAFLIAGCDESASTDNTDANEVSADIAADMGIDSTADIDDEDSSNDVVADSSDITADGEDMIGDQNEDTMLPENCEPIPEAEVQELDLDIPIGEDLEFSNQAVVFKSAAEFETATGIAAPSGFDFQTEWILVVRVGNFYSEEVTVQTVGICEDQGGGYLTVVVERLQQDRDTCSFLDLGGDMPQAFAVPAQTDIEINDRGGVQEDVTPLICDDSSPALGEPCTGESLCQPGAICVGLSHSPTGVCSAETNQFRYDTSVVAPIPDNDPAGAGTINTVPASVEGVIADLGIIYWEIDHPAPNELTYTLTAPDGTTVDIGPTPDGELWRLVSGFDGVTAAGDWTLTVIDTSEGNIGEVDGWAILGTTRPE